MTALLLYVLCLRPFYYIGMLLLWSFQLHQVNLNTLPKASQENDFNHLETLMSIQQYSRTSQVSQAFFSNLRFLTIGEAYQRVVPCFCVPIYIQIMTQNDASHSDYYLDILHQENQTGLSGTTKQK